MRKLLSSPAQMSLSDSENFIYQNVLKHVPELSLNLMAIKVVERPEDFLSWCKTLLALCTNDLNMELLDEKQLKPLKKLKDALAVGISRSQLRMARIAPWPIYVDFIEQQSDIHALPERLRLLNYIDEIRTQALDEMIEEDRLAYCGKHGAMHDHSIYTFDIEWFASTKGAKVFHQLLQQNPNSFEQALQHIPLTGEVTVDHYNHFVSAFQQIFTQNTDNKASGEKAPLAAATRLLAMRRPDQFIALTNSKIDILCQGLSIAKFNHFDFNAYWQDMIGALRTCAWWHQSEPDNETEKVLWNNRAILVELFLSADDSLAQNSNYLKARDKALNKPAKSASTSIARKRSKASAEELVDKALSDESLPAYMQNKRDSLISQVKDGKSIEQAISLMRAIFG